MALIVEDGSGLSDADSYVEVSYIDTYAAAYGKAGWSALTNDVKEVKARQATQFADNVYLNGFRPLVSGQRLAVPAVDMYIRGIKINGVPVQLKDAVAELAVIAVTTDLVEVQTSRNAVQRTVKVGDVSKSETFANDGYRKVFHPVEMLLRPILGSARKIGDGVSTFAMQRA